MISLCLDSSYQDYVVGIAEDGEILSFRQEEAWQRQSEMMIPAIDAVLKETKIDPKEVDEIIVTQGPGSYTGVRIALTIAKVYAKALEIPCYVMSSLMVLENITHPSICLMNARSGRSYIGVYDRSECLLKDQVMKNDDVLKYIEDHKEYIPCGELEYLGIKGYVCENVALNMLELKKETMKVENILALKAIYLSGN
jgi:tRNA threonylcarbamoyladenosine biosynthesis protein TsaB